MPQTHPYLVSVAIKSGAGKWKIHWLRVVRHDGITRYFVQSERANSEQHLVDIEAYFGLGWCGCKNFGINIEPIVCRWKAAERIITDEFRCKHIIAARSYLGEGLVTAFLLAKKREEQQLQRTQCGSDQKRLAQPPGLHSLQP